MTHMEVKRSEAFFDIMAVVVLFGHTIAADVVVEESRSLKIIRKRCVRFGPVNDCNRPMLEALLNIFGSYHILFKDSSRSHSYIV